MGNEGQCWVRAVEFDAAVEYKNAGRLTEFVM